MRTSTTGTKKVQKRRQKWSTCRLQVPERWLGTQKWPTCRLQVPKCEKKVPYHPFWHAHVDYMCKKGKVPYHPFWHAHVDYRCQTGDQNNQSVDYRCQKCAKNMPRSSILTCAHRLQVPKRCPKSEQNEKSVDYRCQKGGPEHQNDQSVDYRCQKGAKKVTKMINMSTTCVKRATKRSNMSTTCEKMCKKGAQIIQNHSFWHELSRGCVPPSKPGCSRGSTTWGPSPRQSFWSIPIQWATNIRNSDTLRHTWYQFCISTHLAHVYHISPKVNRRPRGTWISLTSEIKS